MATFRWSVIAITLVGCADPSATAPRPAFNFINGPATPGPIILRAEAGSRVITNDPSSGLIAIHGKIRDLATCTNASTRVPVDIQRVNTPSDVQGFVIVLQGEDNDVAIYDQGNIDDLSPFVPAKFCAFITTVEPIYEGAVQYRLNINGQGSLDFRWEGTISGPDGVAHHYVEDQHFVATGNDAGRWVNETIRIQ